MTFLKPCLSVSWDPLTEKTDALGCLSCGRPTYALALARQGELRCEACVDRP